MKTQAIVLVAGAGTRMKTETPKSLLTIKEKPLFIYCLESIGAVATVASIILVVLPDRLAEFEKQVKKFKLKKIKKIIPGGQRRCDSVENGLKEVDRDTETVLVHDGARPLVTPQQINDVVAACHLVPAAILAVPIKNTIKEVDPDSNSVIRTIDRSRLWEVQTPQVFHKKVLQKAHAQDKDDNPTDDAVLVERLGVQVKIVQGDYRNIKVTTPEDLKIMEALLS